MSEDFSKASRGSILKPDPNKVRITIRLDADIVDFFKNQVHGAGGGNYQTLINNVLRSNLDVNNQSLEDTIRKVIREELKQVG